MFTILTRSQFFCNSELSKGDSYREKNFNSQKFWPRIPMTEEVDPVEQMLKRTGCIELHYKVQECIAETQDWRKCQDRVKEFKSCMQKYTEAQREKLKY